MARAKPVMTEINDFSEIPENMTEAEAAEFWATHSLGDQLLEQLEANPSESDGLLPATRARRSVSTSVELDTDVIKRLKRLARRRGTGYQVLLREFVLERLYEEEKRQSSS